MAVTRNVASTLMKPNIYEPYAFDATQDYKIEFSYSGPQAHRNRLVIKDNATEAEVYNAENVTMQLKHTIPAGTLENGKAYKAVIYVYDIRGEISPASNFVLFYCLSQPLLAFTNLSSDVVVENSRYEAEFVYSQPEGEPLNSYQVILYNSLGEAIAQSGNRYPNNDNYDDIVAGIAMTYLMTSLDNTKYYLQVVGETKNHLIVDTGLIEFSVTYTNPVVFSLLHLENLEREGQIKIQSNIISITGNSYPDPPTYIDMMEVDNRGNDNGGQHRVWFDEGFSLQKDFTLQLLIRDPQDYSILMEFEEQPVKLELKYMKGCFASQDGVEKAYISLRVYNQLTNYYLQSNYFDPPSSEYDYYHIWLRCVDDMYDLIVEPTTLNAIN